MYNTCLYYLKYIKYIWAIIFQIVWWILNVKLTLLSVSKSYFFRLVLFFLGEILIDICGWFIKSTRQPLSRDRCIPYIQILTQQQLNLMSNTVINILVLFTNLIVHTNVRISDFNYQCIQTRHLTLLLIASKLPTNMCYWHSLI